MNYSGIYNQNIVVGSGESTKISGVLNGSIVVKKGGTLKISGQVSGNILVESGAELYISGIVNGSVTRTDETSKVKVTGLVNGSVVVKESQTVESDDDIIAKIIKSGLAKPTKVDASEMLDIDTSKMLDINIGQFKEENQKKYNITNNNGIINTSSKNSNICYIGNKRVVINSTNGVSISQVNGKSYVNGIDLDTVEPAEDGIYYI